MEPSTKFLIGRCVDQLTLAYALCGLADVPSTARRVARDMEKIVTEEESPPQLLLATAERVIEILSAANPERIGESR